MSIQEVKEKFRNGQISKPRFIDDIYPFHQVLSDFSRALKDTEIEQITISDNTVVMTSRKTDYHVGGIRFIVDSLDKRTVALEAFNFGTYEKEDSEMIYKLISPESHIIDIGANIGWYTLHIARMLTSGSIHCFEPIPETFQKLQDNIQINGLSNIVCNPIALSEKKQQLSFYYNPKQTGASSSRNITENDEVVKLELDSITLDDYVAMKQLTQIDFIKCDVEGAELFVFQGASHVLTTFKPVVFTEMLRKWAAKFGYHPNDIMQLFHNLGYEAYYVEDGSLNKITTITEETIPTNFFFLHTDKHQGLTSQLCKGN